MPRLLGVHDVAGVPLARFVPQRVRIALAPAVLPLSAEATVRVEHAWQELDQLWRQRLEHGAFPCAWSIASLAWSHEVIVQAEGASERLHMTIEQVGGRSTRSLRRPENLSYDSLLCKRIRSLTAAGSSVDGRFEALFAMPLSPHSYVRPSSSGQHR